MLLESFRTTPRIRATNSSRPLMEIKGKGNPNLTWVCSNYWPPIVALSLCFNHLILPTFRQCRCAILNRSTKLIASIHSRVSIQKTLSLTWLRTISTSYILSIMPRVDIQEDECILHLKCTHHYFSMLIYTQTASACSPPMLVLNSRDCF